MEKGMSNGQYRQPSPTPPSGSTGSANPANVGTYPGNTIVTLRTIRAENGTIEEAGIRAGEINAFRAWRVHSDGLLHSMHITHYVWTPNGIEKAELDNPYGGCGIHAYKTLERAKSEYGVNSSGTVYGKVALWGEVIEHEWGYRAQYAKITQIIEIVKPSRTIWDGFWGLGAKRGLRAKYGI